MSDLDFEKYKNDGWGLSVDGFKELYEIISNHPKKELQVLEFGSGTSTRFLVDVATTITTKTINIESYDNSEYWCYKPDRHYDFLDLKIRRLLQCNDASFAKMFVEKKYLPELMEYRLSPPHTRQKNCFYEILPNDLQKKEYDIIILDGPNGNGRSIAFLHLQHMLQPGCYIYVDDYDHHPYPQCLKYIFETEVHKHRKVGVAPGDGDAYIIYKILSSKVQK
jgi:hypothetical protein